MTGDFWEKNKSDEAKINAIFTSKEFTDDYKNLSGKSYKLELKDDIKEGSQLKFEVSINGYDYPQLSVFKFNDSDIKFIDNGINDLTVPNIKKIADDGYDLYALVTNSLAVPPYSEISPISLDIELMQPFDFSTCSIRLYFHVNWHVESNEFFI